VTTGDDYIVAITAHDTDRKARTAFLELALTLAAPGASIFDFGAGPGIDAKHYAEQGYHVLTYDKDPAMRDCLRTYCREQIARGRVVSCDDHPCDAIESVARFAPGVDVELITANFAPFNLLTKPSEEFSKFHKLSSAHGKLLLSVLNPYYLGDMRYGWWWRNTVRLLMQGEYSVAGSTGPIYRRTPDRFKILAAPYFVLRAVMSGLPGSFYRRGLLRRPSLATSRYLFLLFDKCP
jgi:SAM-dependent methyltransferase